MSDVTIEETAERVHVKLDVSMAMDDVASDFNQVRALLDMIDEAASELAAELSAAILQWVETGEPPRPEGEEGLGAPVPDLPLAPAPSEVIDLEQQMRERARRQHPSAPATEPVRRYVEPVTAPAGRIFNPGGVVITRTTPVDIPPPPKMPVVTFTKRPVDHDKIRANAAASI